jgi:D-sedoheptulose 7-phosphate isomerase
LDGLLTNSDWIEYIRVELEESASVKRRLAHENADVIYKIAEGLANSLRSGGKLLLCGNGGSAADCQHLAAELIGRLGPGRERNPFPAIALTTDSSNLTALGNDYGFQYIFSRQVRALGTPGDTLIGISTSGNSQNVVEAVLEAKKKSIQTVGFLGGTGGTLVSLVDFPLIVPSSSVGHIQEAHIAVGHLVCDVAERILLA